MSLLAKKYRQASFRGAPFKVDTVEGEFGRRTIEHEYPQRDLPNTEDLGRKKREFTLEAYVLGDDYESARDSLITACEKTGTGTLIHPYLGTKNVVCKGCRVRESKSELGIAYFSLTFVEAGQPSFPSNTVDGPTSVLNSALGALAAADSAFQNSFSVLSAPSYVLDSASSSVSAFADIVQSQAKLVRADIQKLADFGYTVRNLKAQVTKIINTPAALAAQMQSAIQGIVDLVPGAADSSVKSALKGILNYGSGFPPIPTSTNNRIRQAQNAQALSDLVTQSSIAQYSVQSAQSTYQTFEDALADRDFLKDQIDSISENTKDDQVYIAFQDLRSAAFKAVPSPDQDLFRITSFTPQAPVPSLVLTYNLYNDPSLEADLIARNHIRNPCFIASGRELQVLQRGRR